MEHLSLLETYLEEKSLILNKRSKCQRIELKIIDFKRFS